MTALSPNFTLEELVRSRDALRVGIENTPSAEVIANLATWCALLGEPIRSLLGVPLHVDSGYRSPRLNAYEHGSATSAHMVGCAVDIVPVGLSMNLAFSMIRGAGLPIDQLIFECNAWLHVGMVRPGTAPRGLYELAAAGSVPGNWTYTLA